MPVVFTCGTCDLCTGPVKGQDIKSTFIVDNGGNGRKDNAMLDTQLVSYEFDNGAISDVTWAIIISKHRSDNDLVETSANWQ